jgi:predicted small secreted protein
MKRFASIIGVLALSLFVLAGCGGTSAAQKKAKKAARAVQIQDVTDINQQVEELRQNEPLPHFRDSAALHVQNAYYTADADPNKIWYVILVNYLGDPYASYTTRGAPQPSDDQITNPVQQVCAGGSSGDKNCDVIGLPEPNGVHQGAGGGSYIAISTTGALLRFPSATAHISDQPFNIKGTVQVSINENANISKTDTSKTDGAVVPTGTGTRTK